MTDPERRVQVANLSKCVQHLGPHAIEPGASLVLSDPRWVDHPALQRLADAGVLMLARDQLSQQIVEKAEEADVLSSESPAPAVTAPEGFEGWHINKIRPWLRKQDDLLLLKALYVAEERDKVAALIDARVTELETTP